MPDKQTVVLNQNLHPHAEERLREYTDDFHAFLALQAKECFLSFWELKNKTAP